MTVLTFPSNPTNGQLYNAPNGIRYVYDGVKWVVETTTSTSEAVSNATQDRVAPMFVDGDHEGISFTYNAGTNVLSATVTAVNGDQLVNGDYTLELDTNGALNLPESRSEGIAVIQSTESIQVIANGKTWSFADDGNLTIPENGDILNSTGSSVLSTGISVGDGTGPSVGNVTEILINGDITEIEPGLVGITVSGGLDTITEPAVLAETYKGLQVSYGMIHSNSNWRELNVNKIVIHKPVNPTVSIDLDGGEGDFFEVDGLGSSDVLAMFVVYGDVNGPKSLSTLRAFAEAAIDNVILFEGQSGSYNTVNQMKTAFYASGQQLTAAADGLYTDFEFFLTGLAALNGGVTTVREGSGAIFDIANLGDGTYQADGIQNTGTNYLSGHKIKVLGTSLGGATPANDCIITIDTAVGGEIFQWSVEGTAAGTSMTGYTAVTGTNYNVGSGFAVNDINRNDNGTYNINLYSTGSNYVEGDVITLSGANITGGTAPTNNFIFIVETVGGGGGVDTWSVTGTLPDVWPTDSISDGGRDQYDSNGNYINTNLASDIAYNDGETVADGAAAFGAGSSYSFVYQPGIFGLFVRGSSATTLGTDGASGADSNSYTEAGSLYAAPVAEQTLDNAVTHINISGNPYAGALVSFTHTDGGNEIDILIADDGNGAGVGITRSNQNGIYNPYRDEGGWNSSVSPSGTRWNIDGWNDLSNVESRTYTNLYAAFNGRLGNKIVGTECVMYLPDNGKYYTVKFTQWTQGGGGGFAYTRRELDLDNLQEGIRFPDGTRQITAYVPPTRVKLSSPGNRRIEEVYGYKVVSVAEKTTGNTITTAAYNSNVNETNLIRIDATGTAYSTLVALNGTYHIVQVSLNGNDWINGYVDGWNDEFDYVQIYFNDEARLPVENNQPVYYRIITGGEPVVWWNSSDLPSGSTWFRGAVIDYHAYTNDGTIIGTIHIADDDGNENITHTESSSGNDSVEFDDLWYVDNEGEIKYRRLDTNGSILRIQWAAKVFYGSDNN
jgi:hypothetical protein